MISNSYLCSSSHALNTCVALELIVYVANLKCKTLNIISPVKAGKMYSSNFRMGTIKISKLKISKVGAEANHICLCY